MVLTDEEIADMSLYSPPFSGTPRNTHRDSEVLKRDIAHNLGNDTDTNQIIEYEYKISEKVKRRGNLNRAQEYQNFIYLE
jgi:hypothetical protein